eukprot:scaffold51598_cov78-Cyclotella_meneghiniana.AAC.1
MACGMVVARLQVASKRQEILLRRSVSRFKIQDSRFKLNNLCQLSLASKLKIVDGFAFVIIYLP